MRDLAFQFCDGWTVADEIGFVARGRLKGSGQEPSQELRIARLGDEFPGTEGARMPRIRRVVLSGEDEDLHPRRMRQQIRDQLETFVGGVRPGRQAEVDERERWWRVELPQERDGARARLARVNLEIVAEREGERVGDERVVIDDEEPRARLRHWLWTGGHGCIS